MDGEALQSGIAQSSGKIFFLDKLATRNLLRSRGQSNKASKRRKSLLVKEFIGLRQRGSRILRRGRSRAERRRKDVDSPQKRREE